MEEYVEKASPFANTISPGSLLGKRVLAKSGAVIGTVKGVRLNPDKHFLEGVLVGGIGKTARYVCATYIERMTLKAVLLAIEPASLYEGRAVVSADGKRVGTVTKVNRHGSTNDVESLDVRAGWFKRMSVPFSDVKQLGTSIMLKRNYEDIKRNGKR